MYWRSCRSFRVYPAFTSRSRCVFAVRVKSLRSPFRVLCQSAFARRLFRTVRNERRGLAFRQVRLRSHHVRHTSEKVLTPPRIIFHGRSANAMPERVGVTEALMIMFTTINRKVEGSNSIMGNTFFHFVIFDCLACLAALLSPFK